MSKRSVYSCGISSEGQPEIIARKNERHHVRVIHRRRRRLPSTQCGHSSRCANTLDMHTLGPGGKRKRGNDNEKHWGATRKTLRFMEMP